MTLRISGRRSLQTLAGQSTRPTAARVRQAVFNILQNQVAGSRWLDLCAGSGAMGAEALYRQCLSVVGVELSPKAAQIVKQNWQGLAQGDQEITVIVGDAAQVVPRLALQNCQFDLIYFDPPYHSPVYEQVLPGIPGILAPLGILVVEHHRQHLLTAPPELQRFKQRIYGHTALSLYHQTSAADENEEI